MHQRQSNPALSHISDALGYYVAKEFPITNNRVVVGTSQYGP
jgi:hypothetical protein